MVLPTLVYLSTYLWGFDRQDLGNLWPFSTMVWVRSLPCKHNCEQRRPIHRTQSIASSHLGYRNATILLQGMNVQCPCADIVYLLWFRCPYSVYIKNYFIINKTISDGGITVDFSIIKVHTINWSSNSWGSSNTWESSNSSCWGHRIVGDHRIPLDL